MQGKPSQTCILEASIDLRQGFILTTNLLGHGVFLRLSHRNGGPVYPEGRP